MGLPAPLTSIECPLNILFSDSGICDPKPPADRLTFARLGMVADEAATIMNIGVSLRDMGRTHDALRSFEEALVLLRKIGRERTLAMCLENIGTALRDLGRFSEAYDYFTQAQLLYRRLGMLRDAADCDNAIGVALSASGRPGDALTHFEAARSIYEQLRLPKKLADVGVNEANAFSLVVLAEVNEGDTSVLAGVRDPTDVIDAFVP